MRAFCSHTKTTEAKGYISSVPETAVFVALCDIFSVLTHIIQDAFVKKYVLPNQKRCTTLRALTAEFGNTNSNECIPKVRMSRSSGFFRIHDPETASAEAEKAPDAGSDVRKHGFTHTLGMHPFKLIRRLIMALKEYFEEHKGTGVLATADSEGKADAAIYAKPHIMEDGTLALIMRDRLSHSNLQSNPHAAYLFIENGEGYKGIRLFLTRIREEKDSEQLFELRRRSYPNKGPVKDDPMYLVFFKIEKEMPLVGPGDAQE